MEGTSHRGQNPTIYAVTVRRLGSETDFTPMKTIPPQLNAGSSRCLGRRPLDRCDAGLDLRILRNAGKVEV
jgi:hypothetical protein